MNPEDISYHREHTWVRVVREKAIVGITDYAQASIGDIVDIDLPETEIFIEADSELAEIESTKTTFSVISPVSGTVLEVNEDLPETPEIINEDPYGRGWIAIIELKDIAELDDLMDAVEYERYEEKVKLR